MPSLVGDDGACGPTQPHSDSRSVLELNEDFVRRHRAELQSTGYALRLSGAAFLARAVVQLTSDMLRRDEGWLGVAGALAGQLESICFGCFLLHAWHKLRRLMKGYTTHQAADEVCSALAAVGDCLVYFGWVVAFEVLERLLNVLSMLLLGRSVTFEAMAGVLTATMRLTLIRAVEEHRQGELAVLALCLGAWLWLRAGLGAVVRSRVQWFKRAVGQEVRDVRLWKEQRSFEAHCANGTVDAAELREMLSDMGYSPTERQFSKLMAVVRGKTQMNLAAFMEQIEAVLGTSPTRRNTQRSVSPRKLRPRSSSRRLRSAPRSPSPLPRRARRSGSLA